MWRSAVFKVYAYVRLQRFGKIAFTSPVVTVFPLHIASTPETRKTELITLSKTLGTKIPDYKQARNIFASSSVRDESKHLDLDALPRVAIDGLGIDKCRMKHIYAVFHLAVILLE